MDLEPALRAKVDRQPTPPEQSRVWWFALLQDAGYGGLRKNSGEDFWDSEYRFRVCERLCDGGVKAQSTMGLRERVRGLKILDFASLLPRGGR